MGWDENIKLKMRTVIGNIIFFAALLLIISRFLSVWAGTPFPIDLVTSDSMSPTLMKGDVIAWTPTRIEDIKEGDVIVFKSYLNWPDEKILVHRVSDIKKDSQGQPILETKGDANEWVDQEGPHIPEPYIRESNLMGKVISIDQIPLKIPFVGYLGVWVNDGIKALSEPTSSKGSLSYAGIFSPLIISAVALVILTLVTPEKTKTIKQKIKKHIFGPRKINLKKTLIFFLLIYLMFFTIIHFFAFESVTASVGIEQSSQSSDMNFGRIKKGTESLPKDLPVVNPSISTVKGIIFGKGEVNEYVSRKVFQLNSGEERPILLSASASNNTKNGSYYGEIMVYSSPFWMFFPDDFMQHLCNWNAEATVYILDFLTAVILTTITGLLLISITLTTKLYEILSIDLSWKRKPHPILKKQTMEKIKNTKTSFKKYISKKIGWITKTDIAETEKNETPAKSFIKPVLASLIVLPILYIISDQMIAMIAAVFITAVIAYLISCKLRRKIIITVIITMAIIIAHMIIQSNIIIIDKGQTNIEILAYSTGAIGIYLLLFGLLLIPLTLASTFIVRQIRNLKERKEPLLILEGKCDL